MAEVQEQEQVRVTKANCKRNDYLSWDDYFMSVCVLSSMRSKDPHKQVGACIVNKTNHIIGIGYNGFPRGCSDDELPWGREGPALETKYPYVCHAELNAVLNKNQASAEDCRLYVSLFPCNECAKTVIQAGIKEVIYLSNKHAGQDTYIAARKLFELANVATRQFIPSHPQLHIDFVACSKDDAVKSHHTQKTQHKEKVKQQEKQEGSEPGRHRLLPGVPDDVSSDSCDDDSNDNNNHDHTTRSKSKYEGWTMNPTTSRGENRIVAYGRRIMNRLSLASPLIAALLLLLLLTTRKGIMRRLMTRVMPHLLVASSSANKD